jgi:hypothetical protein
VGLDMYAFSIPEAPESPVDFETPSEGRHNLHYWRKHPNLHGWMEDLYRSKGGTDSDFNGALVVLTQEDLTELQLAIEDGTLPYTNGFFFGVSDGSETVDDLEFIRKALNEIKDGRTVYYTSWW